MWITVIRKKEKVMKKKWLLKKNFYIFIVLPDNFVETGSMNLNVEKKKWLSLKGEVQSPWAALCARA